MSDLAGLHTAIEESGAILKEILEASCSTGGFTEGRYTRILQMQYHLTKEVQRYFLSAAAHPCMSGKREFREFLFNFALEEEPHFDIAKSDLESLGHGVGQCPLDVKLWHAYFSKIVVDRPYIRLGAASVLETIGTLASDIIKQLLQEATFLTESNTRFIVIHMHETLPHGTQFLLELTNSEPTASEVADLVLGAQQGSTMYMRMARWALGQDSIQERLSRA